MHKKQNEIEKLEKRFFDKKIYAKYLKRPIDFFLALISLIVLSPLIIIIAILVKIKLGGLVIFKQRRPGRNGKLFTLYKFRTMNDARDENGELLPDEIRLTKFGKFLRSTSLDELPELINILNGSLAIVGPRPLLEEYLPLYNAHQQRRHDVRPGLTGYAQVNGRNSISWEEKFKLDLHYIDRITFLGDMKIILMTVYKVIKREGISSKTTATMEPFKGTKENVDLTNVEKDS